MIITHNTKLIIDTVKLSAAISNKFCLSLLKIYIYLDTNNRLNEQQLQYKCFTKLDMGA